MHGLTPFALFICLYFGLFFYAYFDGLIAILESGSMAAREGEWEQKGVPGGRRVRPKGPRGPFGPVRLGTSFLGRLGRAEPVRMQRMLSLKHMRFHFLKKKKHMRFHSKKKKHMRSPSC